ncbi:hypothetical protein, partial [Candidatus Magnetobacterium casense]|uniref:hypothetical protein n=1 Tax=Candidatus Magnetobacterium casense TaxID=1455061 RepID=UPI001C4397F9
WGPDFYQNEYSLRQFREFASYLKGVQATDVRCLCHARYALRRTGIVPQAPATYRILIEKDRR